MVKLRLELEENAVLCGSYFKLSTLNKEGTEFGPMFVLKFLMLQVHVNTLAFFTPMLAIMMVIVISETLFLREGFYKDKPTHYYLIFVIILHCICVL